VHLRLRLGAEPACFKTNEGPNGANKGPNGANEGPNGVNEGPNGANEGPNGAKEGPNGANEGPNGPNEGPELYPVVQLFVRVKWPACEGGGWGGGETEKLEAYAGCAPGQRLVVWGGAGESARYGTVVSLGF
jgi:hypothetical protein